MEKSLGINIDDELEKASDAARSAYWAASANSAEKLKQVEMIKEML